ncbi:hypothetical protein B1R32_12726 [Abditibacterium utsteinense]|uniref:Uncharacterized protein n=1 Tax=Abditibacterium utsteinense TaxID=1960156 RepID=A0A2S8SPA7_9BACT|nr:hypothetical protein B1R32_12726 [Abditibacterium utsteinense]
MVELAEKRLDEKFGAVGEGGFVLVEGECRGAAGSFPFELDGSADQTVALFVQFCGFDFQHEISARRKAR